MIRTFEQLTEEEQDSVIERLHVEVLSEALCRRKLPIDTKIANDAVKATEAGGRVTPRLELWSYDIAGMLAEDAYYIPDDGTMVVRL